MRLAMTRASRRRSPRMIARSARSVHVTGDVGAELHGDGVAHELAHLEVLEVEADRAGVEPADLQEVLDEAAGSGRRR